MKMMSELRQCGTFFPIQYLQASLGKGGGSWCGIVHCKERPFSSNNENGISIWDIISDR